MSSVATSSSDPRYNKFSLMTAGVLVWFHIMAAIALFQFSWTNLFVAVFLYWVAIGYLWQSLGTLILPDAVREIVGSARQGTALSVLEGIGTVVA